MAMSHPMSATHPPQEASHRGAPAPTTSHPSVSPPSRRELKSWWKNFRRTNKDDDKVEIPPGIFGVALADSIKYANVAISLTDDHGDSFIYGYVPIVVAKCGVFLKEKATDVEGIFRLSGSAKRIKDLQSIFNSPERYGKGLDWTGYTVHDAANILRRYLNQLPEPIVPLEFYERFRDPLRGHQAQALGDTEQQGQSTELSDFDHAKAVTTYQRLITELPALNRQLLLYILDLLAVFSSKSDLNRMTSANLAAIFQPGIISHPSHDMAPQEYRLSQDVVIFLIENQDNFLIGMSGTAIDEKTNKEVQGGLLATPSSPKPSANIGRSASNASAGADSLRRLSQGIRRNVSVSSRQSKDSRGGVSPGNSSPGSGFGGTSSGVGVHRSNTVPSKKSPALGSARFGSRGTGEGSPAVSPGQTSPLMLSSSRPSALSAANPAINVSNKDGEDIHRERLRENTLQVPSGFAPPPAVHSPGSERKISSLFKKAPPGGSSSDTEKKETRQPRRLQKKHPAPGSANESAQSSQASLQAEYPINQTFSTPMASPDVPSQTRADPLASAGRQIINTTAPSTNENQSSLTQPSGPTQQAGVHTNHTLTGSLLPPGSPEMSIHSGASMTDHSDLDVGDHERHPKGEKKRHRWRMSASVKKEDGQESPLAPPPRIGENTRAGRSNSSLASSTKPRKSFTGESQRTHPVGVGTDAASGPIVPESSQDSESIPKDHASEPEKKAGLFGKLRAKVAHSREERKEREAEKSRSPSTPTVSGTGEGGRHSFSAFRGKSIDKPREHSTDESATKGPAPDIPTQSQSQPPSAEKPSKN